MEFTTILAYFTSAILVLQLLLGFFIGADSDIDVDGDSSGDIDVSTVFSPKGLLHFVCGSSWYLVSVGKSVYSLTDYAVAFLIGSIFALIMVGVYWLMWKLQKEIIPETGESLVGRSGTVYLRLNEKDYTIEIERNGRMQFLDVRSENKVLEVLEKVTIKKFEDNIYYV